MTGIGKPRWHPAVALAATLLAGAIGAMSLPQASGARSSSPLSTGSLSSAFRHATLKRIPSKAKVVDLKQVGQAGNSRSVTITRLRQVHRFARLIDDLPVQTVFAPCPPPPPGSPAPAEGPSVHLTFRATAEGAPLAEAVQEVPVGICDPLQLTIHGHEQEPRIHGRIVVRAVRGVFER
jgi:hypothetical protein